MSEQPPKIEVDSDWKAEARKEKERLSQKAQSGDQQQQAGGGQRPADFSTLISTMATQALFALGEIPDPRTGQRMMSLEMARHQIDMLGILEEKTKGNLTEEEQSLLSGTVYELRQRYIAAASNQSARGGAAGAGGAGTGGPGGASGGGAEGFAGPGL